MRASQRYVTSLAATAVATTVALYLLWVLRQSFKSTDSQHEINDILTAAASASKTTNPSSNLLVVTRVHMKSASAMPDPLKIVEFVKNTHSYATKILVCVGAADSGKIDEYIVGAKRQLVELLLDVKVTFLPVQPWGYFVYPLNIAIEFAQDNDCQRVAFQSVEFAIQEESVRRLMGISSNDKVLVVGPEMNGHEFNAGHNKVTGRSCPWNTFAIWNVPHLALTGFPLIGDGVAMDRKIGGVEEVSTVNLLQLVNPELLAVLVRFSRGSVEWNTHFDDPERQLYHNNKMKSKNERPAKQMKAMNLKEGSVYHLLLQD